MIINILSIACIGVMIQSFEFYQQLLQKLYLDTKPFNCTMCFTFWMSIGHTLYEYGIAGIGVSAIAAVTAEYIDQKLKYE